MARNSNAPEAKENMRLKIFQKENSCENLTHGDTAHPRQSGEKSVCSSEMTTTALHFGSYALFHVLCCYRCCFKTVIPFL